MSRISFSTDTRRSPPSAGLCLWAPSPAGRSCLTRAGGQHGTNCRVWFIPAWISGRWWHSESSCFAQYLLNPPPAGLAPASPAMTLDSALRRVWWGGWIKVRVSGRWMGAIRQKIVIGLLTLCESKKNGCQVKETGLERMDVCVVGRGTTPTVFLLFLITQQSFGVCDMSRFVKVWTFLAVLEAKESLSVCRLLVSLTEMNMKSENKLGHSGFHSWNTWEKTKADRLHSFSSSLQCPDDRGEKKNSSWGQGRFRLRSNVEWYSSGGAAVRRLTAAG